MIQPTNTILVTTFQTQGACFHHLAIARWPYLNFIYMYMCVYIPLYDYESEMDMRVYLYKCT